jgi:predicted permease
VTTHDPPRPPGVRRLFRFSWLTRKQIADDVDAELAFHLAQAADELHAAGWSMTESRIEALRRFGDITYTKNYCRGEDTRRELERRRMTLFEELGQDLRYAIRALRSSPGFTMAALFTLALGIGANTAIFSVVRGVLLEPLPFRDTDRLVRVWHGQPSGGITQASVSEPDFLDWQRDSKRASSIGGYFFADGLSGVNLTGLGNPERLSSALVTDGFFQTLGTLALLGRTLQTDDQIIGRNHVVVLSHGLWTRRFGADPAIVGRSLTLSGQPYQVAGVMPPGFTYPADRSIDVWVPLSTVGPDGIGRSRGAHFLQLIAKLAPGTTEQQLDAELSGIATRLSTQYPENPGWTDVTTLNLRESILGPVRRPLVVLMAAVAMLLLITCVNIASLLLARASGRQRELAVRAALGAGRGRIARQLLTESMTLALLGGALGIAFGVVAGRALAAAGASELPRANDIRVDGWVLAFSLGVALLCGILFGVAPAIRASVANLQGMLRAGARGAVGASGQYLRSGLVVAEVALAAVLVVGAGLATKSFARLLDVSPGWEPSNALVLTMSVPDRFETREARLAYYNEVLNSLRRLPGVQAVGSVRDLPLRGNGEMIRVSASERPAAPNEGQAAQLHHVSTDYFKAMGVPLKLGRAFEITDVENTPIVMMINEELAKRLWPGERPEGKQLRVGNSNVPVVGVVGDMRQRGLAEPVDPAVYIHAMQNFRSRMSIVIRTQGEPTRLADAARRAVWSLDSEQTITSITTLESVLGVAVARPRLLAWLLALFGAIGMTLGALGIFGVLAYTVNQRRQEIGVRVALGASPRSVLGLVVGQGMVLAIAGVVLGMVGAALLTRSMQSVLFGIAATDIMTFVQVGVVLLLAALLASWLPARRALGIDPVTALRYD